MLCKALCVLCCEYRCRCGINGVKFWYLIKIQIVQRALCLWCGMGQTSSAGAVAAAAAAAVCTRRRTRTRSSSIHRNTLIIPPWSSYRVVIHSATTSYYHSPSTLHTLPHYPACVWGRVVDLSPATGREGKCSAEIRTRIDSTRIPFLHMMANN